MKTIKAFAALLITLLLVMTFAGCNSENTEDLPKETTSDNLTPPVQTTPRDEMITPSPMEPHSHSYNDWIILQEATCTEDGYKLRECACGYIEEELITTAGHSESEWIIDKEATTITNGLHHKVCTVCNIIVKEETIYIKASTGLAYTVNDDKSSCTITGIGTCTDSFVIIPEIIDGYSVTAIEKRAFYECTSITEVLIPKSVKNIGPQIFHKASNLHTVYYNSGYGSQDNQFLNLEHITKIVFGGSQVPYSALSKHTYVKTVEILDSVTLINMYAFNGCTGLTNITIPDSVTQIETNAFTGCSNLTSINLPESITKIGPYSFASCSSLESLIIPASVTNWSYNTFSNCTNLKNVVINSNVTRIQSQTFYYCKNLTSITIPSSVIKIEGSALFGCSSLKDIYYDGTKDDWSIVVKERDWDGDTGSYTVHCTDGDITN